MHPTPLSRGGRGGSEQQPVRPAKTPTKRNVPPARSLNDAAFRSAASAGPDPADEAGERIYNIAAVDRALDLLEALARVGPATLAVLSSEAGCTRTAGFRLLRTLQARGFAIQDKSRGVWRLGARWGMLSQAASDQGALAATAQPFLATLGATVGENVYLRAREGLESETVAVYQADPQIRMYTDVGKRRPLHAGSSRLLLAYAPDPVQTQVLSQKLPRFTPATRTDPEWIAADLLRIRNRGWLITADEVSAGAVSVAAPVRDASGQVVAVLFISASNLRMRPPRPRSLLPQVMEAAANLSRALGDRSPAPVPPPIAPPRKGSITGHVLPRGL